jgi:hypothetical protein
MKSTRDGKVEEEDGFHHTKIYQTLINESIRSFVLGTVMVDGCHDGVKNKTRFLEKCHESKIDVSFGSKESVETYYTDNLLHGIDCLRQDDGNSSSKKWPFLFSTNKKM